jgi:uncharacterized phage protein (TIGR01671 family)
MREIKFRAWHKKDKQMIGAITVLRFDPDGIRGWAQCNWNDKKNNAIGNFQPEEVELMQYTGLLDKNGKEIYEGDLVKGQVASEVEGAEPFRFEATKVVWCEECGGFHLMGFFHDCLYRFSNQNAVEVIGNIYENSELLSKEE